MMTEDVWQVDILTVLKEGKIVVDSVYLYRQAYQLVAKLLFNR